MDGKNPSASQALGSWLGPIVRAGLNTAPFTGGIASLWSDWDTSRRFQRVEAAIADLGQTLSSTADFDPSRLSDPEMHLLEDALNRIAREHRETKRKRFVRLIAAAWSRTSAPFEERMLFNRALDEFDDVHIRILGILASVHPDSIHADELLAQTFKDPDEFCKFGPFLSATNALAAQYGFIRRKTDGDGRIMMGINPDGLAFHVLCTITPLGQRFYDAMKEPGDAQKAT